MEEGACDALLLAFAGVSRMGYSHMIRQIPDLETFTPAVGQGSLAIEASTHLDPSVQHILTQALSDPETRICLEAERAFLRAMEGGCSVPVFGYAQRNGHNLILSGGIISLDGKEEVRMKNSLSWPYEGENSHLETGKKLAAQILDAGGASILSKIKQTLQP